MSARPEGFEPPTRGLEVRCSIQLSYGRLRSPARGEARMERVTGIEPAWPAWKAGALPLSYTRVRAKAIRSTCTPRHCDGPGGSRSNVGVVGAARFELATSCSQSRRANQAALRPVARRGYRSTTGFARILRRCSADACPLARNVQCAVTGWLWWTHPPRHRPLLEW